jgi:hypothetical protein
MAFDPDEFLKEEKKKPSAAPVAAPVAAGSGFDPDAFLASEQTAPVAEPSMVAETAVPSTTMPDSGVAEAVGAISPAVTATQIMSDGSKVVLKPTGVAAQLADTAAGRLATNVGQVAQPYATAASKVLGQYASNPLTKLAPDLAAMAAGIPPPIASAQALGATQGAYNVAQQIVQGKPIPGAGPRVSTAVPAASASEIASNAMSREIAARNAAAQAETLANRSMIQKLAMSKVMQTMGGAASAVAPALNTAARVAGPAGLAYNVYEAGQMARDTQLGPRLAQGQGQQAEQAFRQMNVPYGAGFNQTITPDQARAVLASQNSRDIQAFGGLDFLRKKALGQ